MGTFEVREELTDLGRGVERLTRECRGDVIYMARRPQAARIGQRATTAQQVLSLASAALVVTLFAAANQLVGPTFAGAVGAFPVMTTTMALFIAHRSGTAYAATVMRGLVKSLPIYLTYCLVFAFMVTRLPTAWAVLTALALALVLAMLTRRRRSDR